ncbi:hypothetical protein RFI_16772, partial [Reticulomyxa filosa]
GGGGKKKKKKKKKKGIQREILTKVYGESSSEKTLQQRMNKTAFANIDKNTQIDLEDEWGVNPLFLNASIFDRAAFETMNLLKQSFCRFMYTKEYEIFKKVIRRHQTQEKFHDTGRFSKTLHALVKATSAALEENNQIQTQTSQEESVHKMVSLFEDPVYVYIAKSYATPFLLGLTFICVFAVIFKKKKKNNYLSCFFLFILEEIHFCNLCHKGKQTKTLHNQAKRDPTPDNKEKQTIHIPTYISNKITMREVTGGQANNNKKKKK